MDRQSISLSENSQQFQGKNRLGKSFVSYDCSSNSRWLCFGNLRTILWNWISSTESDRCFETTGCYAICRSKNGTIQSRKSFNLCLGNSRTSSQWIDMHTGSSAKCNVLLLPFIHPHLFLSRFHQSIEFYIKSPRQLQQPNLHSTIDIKRLISIEIVHLMSHFLPMDSHSKKQINICYTIQVHRKSCLIFCLTNRMDCYS